MTDDLGTSECLVSFIPDTNPIDQPDRPTRSTNPIDQPDWAHHRHRQGPRPQRGTLARRWHATALGCRRHALRRSTKAPKNRSTEAQYRRVKGYGHLDRLADAITVEIQKRQLRLAEASW